MNSFTLEVRWREHCGRLSPWERPSPHPQQRLLGGRRRIAQEESFGNASLVRELNLSEILSRAKIEADELISEQKAAVEAAQRQLETERELAAKRLEEEQSLYRNQAEKERQLAEQRVAEERKRAARDKEIAVKSAAEEARRQLAAQLEDSNRRRAHRWADRVMVSIRIIAVLVFVSSGLALWLTKGETHTAIWLVPLTLFFGLISLLEFLHLIGMHLVEQLLERVREKTASTLLRFFRGP